MGQYVQTIDTVFAVGTLLACFLGLVAAIVLLVRGRVAAGLLALVGFGLLALQYLLSLANVLFRLWRSLPSGLYEVVYIVIFAVGPFLGVLALAVAFFLAVRPTTPPRGVQGW